MVQPPLSVLMRHSPTIYRPNTVLWFPDPPKNEWLLVKAIFKVKSLGYVPQIRRYSRRTAPLVVVGIIQRWGWGRIGLHSPELVIKQPCGCRVPMILMQLFYVTRWIGVRATWWACFLRRICSLSMGTDPISWWWSTAWCSEWAVKLLVLVRFSLRILVMYPFFQSQLDLIPWIAQVVETQCIWLETSSAHFSRRRGWMDLGCGDTNLACVGHGFKSYSYRLSKCAPGREEHY